jgi:predicted nucleic acid-binding protein
MKTFVLDSSVVAKCVLPETDSRKVQKLADEARVGAHELIVLDIAFIEVANAIWKRRRLRQVTHAEAPRLLDILLKLPVIAHDAASLLPAGFEIAVKYDRAVYDALFVALARQLKVPGLTADEPLFNAVRGDFPEIQLLRNV